MPCTLKLCASFCRPYDVRTLFTCTRALPSAFAPSLRAQRRSAGFPICVAMLRLVARRRLCCAAARGFASAAATSEQATTGGGIGVCACSLALRGTLHTSAHLQRTPNAARPADGRRGHCRARARGFHVRCAAREVRRAAQIQSRRPDNCHAAPARFRSPPPPWSRRCFGCSTARLRTTSPSGPLRMGWCRASAVLTHSRFRCACPCAPCASAQLICCRLHSADNVVGPALSEPAGSRGWL